MADIAGRILDLYTSNAGKRLDMELLSAPLVSVTADGQVETQAQLRWGPSHDEVLMEGSLRDLGDGELELTPMTARSTALGISLPQLQPARRLTVLYADRELLVFRDKEGMVDALWREGYEQPVAASEEVAEPNEKDEEGGSPRAREAAVPEEEDNEGSDLPASEDLAEEGTLERLEDLAEEGTLERLEDLAEEGTLERLEDRAEEALERLDEREAAAEEKIGRAESRALRAIDTKLETLAAEDVLKGAERQLKDFEDRAAAKLRGLDAKLADRQAKAKEAEVIALTAAVEAEQKVKELQDRAAAEMRDLDAKLADHQAKAKEAELITLTTAVEADQMLKQLQDASALAEAKAVEAEDGALKAAALVDKKLKQLKDASAQAEASAGKACEERLARFEREVEKQEAYLEERMAEFNTAVEAISHAREAWYPREEQLQEAEDAVRRRLEAAISISAERAGERLEERGRGLGKSVFQLLRAESDRLEKQLGERFSVLSKRLEEAPGRDESMREELRAELEALRKQLDEQRSPRRRRFPWSS